MTLTVSMLTLAFLPYWALTLLLVLFTFVCVIMILAVLYQKPSGGGLAGAFGGGNVSSGQTAFGAKTGDALTIFTIAVFVVFLLAAIGLVHAMKPPKEGPAAPVVQPVETAPASGAVPTPPPQPGEQPAGAVTPAPTPEPAPAPAPAPSPTPAPTPAPGSTPK